MDAQAPLTPGHRFGELTLTTVPWQERHGAVVACKCDCGKHLVARVEKLRSGRTARCKPCSEKRHGRR